jgi:hypothetical protein
MSDVMIDEICCVAMAEAFRGDGEILCNPIGTVPIIGGRTGPRHVRARLMMTDTVAALIATRFRSAWRRAKRSSRPIRRYRTIFDIVWSGKRHVVMGRQPGRHVGQSETSRPSATGASPRRSCSVCAALPATPSTTR